MVVVLALVACLGFCVYKKCCNKGKKPKKARERKAGRGRRKKDKDGEEGGDEKKVSRDEGDIASLVLPKVSCLFAELIGLSQESVYLPTPTPQVIMTGS